MANTTPQDIGGSDPSIERQIQRETSTVLSAGRVSGPPPVNTGSSLSGQTANLRSIAPVVSGSETVFPQSTAQTSGNAVTITSSVNNDSGDITTVYTSASRINVNPVNQTINQYTSVDSGVSQIVAGDNITVTSTGGNGTGTITISANASAVSYGDSNVVSLLENFGSNTISTTGNISAGNFAGNGAGLTSIQGSSVSGQVSYAAVANSVAAANVSGLGNISAINLDGNASNVLRGDGTFSADANSTYNNSNVVSLLSAFGSNTITTTGLITGNGGGLSNIPYANITGAPVLGNISGINIDGNSSNVLLGNGVFNQLGISSISGVGNIATINLDGNASNVLRGNGSFGPEANGVVGNTLTANLDANGFFISNAANIVANYFVGTATNVEVEAVNNNYSYHIVLTTGSGDTTLHIDADDNFQYDPQDGIMTVTRADTEFLSVTNSVISNLIPFDSLPLNLGSNTNRWNDIYLSNSTIYLGNATISANGNSIVVDSIIVGNNGPVGNIASINLNGNANSVLRGDGTWGTDANSSYGDSNVVSLLGAFGSNNINTTGNITGIFANGNSNIRIPVANGNILFATNGSNAMVIDTNGNVGIGNTNPTLKLVVDGTIRGNDISALGNITAPNISAGPGNLSGARLTVTNTANLGNVGNVIITGGSNGQVLTTNGSGNLSWTTVSGVAANTANTVINNAQPNITSVGTLTGLSVSGSITASSLSVSGNITSNANIVTDLIVGRTTGISIASAGTDQPVFLKPTGNGAINVWGAPVSNVGTPVSSTDAATKQYVDNVAQGLHTHAPCSAATPDTLANISSGTITYNNGSSGVDANLVTTGSFATIDGVNIASVGTRILVKNEANTAHNGIYTYANSTTLVRATDFDTPTEMAGGDFTFVQQGLLYNDTGWVMTDPVTTVGTSPVTFVQFSGAGTYTAGTGLTLTGTQFSVTNTAVTAATYGNGDYVATFTVNQQGQLTAAANTAITANAANLTGTSLASSIVNSSLTSVGTLTGLSVNGNITAANITANTGVFTGNGAGLTNVPGGNVTGEVSYAAVANSIAGANVTGEVSYAAVANSVAVANVSGIGNIATINLDGNTSNVLLGNGVFATIPYPSQTGQTGNILKTDGSVAAWGNINFDATVYVSKNGNDSTGDGSINKPFLTLTAAQNAITDNSPTKRYAIMVSPGTYTESGSFGIKRDVFIIGAGINATRIGATTITMNADFNQSGSPDDRSGFMNCGLLNNCDFNWLTVNSAAGKLYFTNVSFSGNLSVYGGTNAIAQAQMHSCLVFGSFTNSGINLGVGTNNIFFGSITMTQHPNGGMATICSFTGGAVSGAVTLNTTVSDFNRRCSLFARSFYMGGGLTINGPSSYADATADSLNGSPTVTNSGTLVNLNPNILANPTSSPILPVTTNATNFGDWGKQWFWSFAYVHASTGTDCYLISYPSAYGAASVGANVGIYADGAGLQANVNGGNIEIGTATASGNGIRGEIVLDGRQINVSNVKIVNLANATSNTDAVNLQQLNAVSSNSKVLTTTTTANLSSITNSINTTGKTTGLMLFNTTDNLIYVAGGGSNNSPWYPSNGGSAITPV